MKSSLPITMLASTAMAFPTMEALASLAELNVRSIDPSAPQGQGAFPLVPPPFDAAAQLVDVSGTHSFIAPGPGDARGPCPGLNAMANHNYIPRNGIATIQQFVDGSAAVFGMGPDLSEMLARYGAWMNGDGAKWSIGGTPRTGISGSHNNYESDSSAMFSDLNQYGSNQNLVMSQFRTLYDAQPNASTANYNMEAMRTFRGQRFAESIAKNPNFAFFPLSGLVACNAAFAFVYRFMGNKSAEYPAGVLNKDVLKSFIGITGPEDNLTWTYGTERIPENWYKRNDADQYGLVGIAEDLLFFSEKHPEIISLGCNQGRVNSYNSIDPSKLTLGAYNASSVASNPACFGLQYGIRTMLDAAVPSGLVGGLLAPVTTPLKTLLSGVLSSLADLGCAPIAAIDETVIDSICPGLSIYGGPTGPVAAAAIQS